MDHGGLLIGEVATGLAGQASESSSRSVMPRREAGTLETTTSGNGSVTCCPGRRAWTTTTFAGCAARSWSRVYRRAVASSRPVRLMGNTTRWITMTTVMITVGIPWRRWVPTDGRRAPCVHETAGTPAGERTFVGSGVERVSARLAGARCERSSSLRGTLDFVRGARRPSRSPGCGGDKGGAVVSRSPHPEFSAGPTECTG
jgi:hypothetical protein